MSSFVKPHYYCLAHGAVMRHIEKRPQTGQAPGMCCRKDSDWQGYGGAAPALYWQLRWGWGFLLLPILEDLSQPPTDFPGSLVSIETDGLQSCPCHRT